MKQHLPNSNRVAIIVALAVVAGREGTAQVNSTKLWDSTRAVAIDDPATHMRAFTLQVPTGWKYAGMIVRSGGCHPPRVPADGLSFSVVAPDGITAWEKLPGVSWYWYSDNTNIDPKCHGVKITTAEEFLLNIAIPNLRPDAKITLVPIDPKFREALDATNRSYQARGTPQQHQTVDSARIRVQYMLKGRPVEEMIGAIVGCTEIDMPAYPVLHRAAQARHLCQATGTVIRRAPQGALDAFLAKDPPPPIIDPQWDAFIQQNMRNQFNAWLKANDDQFRAITEHFKEVNAGMLKRGTEFQKQQQRSFDNAMAQDRATQSAIDHAAQMQVRDSLNRSLFIDPSTGRKIETSNQYGHNWISSDGQSVVINNDPTFDPNGLVDPVRISWTELIPMN